jgi:hypothetical protein
LLLLAGFASETRSPLPNISLLANQSLGSTAPVDLTGNVCRKKPIVALVRARDLKGWGISLGSYDTAQQADLALRSRLLSPTGLGIAGSAGVIKLAGSNGFAAVVWDIAESRGRAACMHLRSEETYCNVMTPENFRTLAAVVPEARSNSGKVQAQGSDVVKPETTPRAGRQ